MCEQNLGLADKVDGLSLGTTSTGTNCPMFTQPRLSMHGQDGTKNTLKECQIFHNALRYTFHIWQDPIAKTLV